MSERREFYASTLPEAIQKATSDLSVDPDALSYEVFDEGSAGFLGLGARDARIMVDVPAPEDVSPASEKAPHHPAKEADPDEESSEDAASPGEEGQPAPESVAEHERIPDELLEEIRQHVETTLDAMAFDGEVSARDSGEVVFVDIASEDAGLLIGQKGETIDALQYLVNVAIYRKREFSKKVVLDCGGYRQRRENAVQGMAHRSAKRVAKEGVELELPPMSSSERRAVHEYLKEDPRVETSSVGDDENRRVNITPIR